MYSSLFEHQFLLVLFFFLLQQANRPLLKFFQAILKFHEVAQAVVLD